MEKIATGTVHRVPTDLGKALVSQPKALAKWNELTPLARNEWICWNTSVKLAATRKEHIERTIAQLLEGKRRPCCWMGCVHRTDKPISPSVRWLLESRKKSNR